MPKKKVRRRLTITGQVQGVGFRPFVYRLALDHNLTGTVRNSPEGVVIEIQGGPESAEAFEHDLENRLPPLARIVSLDAKNIEPVGREEKFEILASTAGKGHSVLISPDIATCPDCLKEIFDRQDRRYLYPFTNCTNCGPRYTITRSIPYDRPFTSMNCFPMCEKCQGEYEDPLDRRFHAQPNACPDCGPEVWLTDMKGGRISQGDNALRILAQALADGKVAAIKGLGGFHLACDATNALAVSTLRQRKNRPDKPLAVMVPDMTTARKLVYTSPDEEMWLTGMYRPIVLAKKKQLIALAPGVAPDTEFAGVMLPYTPLHHILLHHLAKAIGDMRPAALVMTSGNMSSEPICLGNREALKRLKDIADLYLFHNRDILIRTDDSVLRVNPESGEPLFMRRARGFTPTPVFLSQKGPSVLGLGPELKCTLCLTKENQAFPSQHIGNMENLETLGFYEEITEHLKSILQTEPVLAVRDLHPNYMTTEIAGKLDIPVIGLQHHYAHIHSVLAETRHQGPAIGLALDGTGFGEDGTIWGGECLYVNNLTLEHKRLAHFTPIRLPGGEAAVREPWRIAQGLLWDLGVKKPGKHPWPWLEEHQEASNFLPQVLEKNINTPMTSSCGRLFDAVSALLGLVAEISYEGQAAIMLERVQDMKETSGYPCSLLEGVPAVLDTRTLFSYVLGDAEAGVEASIISRRFHLGLIRGLAEMAALFAGQIGVKAIALSGGVMQNLTLATELPKALAQKGLTPLVHTIMSPNDGCISLGQAAYGQKYLLLGK